MKNIFGLYDLYKNISALKVCIYAFAFGDVYVCDILTLTARGSTSVIRI